DFPKADGNTMQDVLQGLPEGPILAPSVSVLEPDATNRVAFALFDAARKQLTGAGVAVYISRPDGTDARGPFIAPSESLAVKPAFQTQTVAQDPNAAKSLSVADVPFRKKGQYALVGIARLDGRTVATNPQGVKVGAGVQPPQVGQRATVIHTPTVQSAGGVA